MSRRKYIKNTFLNVETFKTLNVSAAQVNRVTVGTEASLILLAKISVCTLVCQITVSFLGFLLKEIDYRHIQNEIVLFNHRK